MDDYGAAKKTPTPYTAQDKVALSLDAPQELMDLIVFAQKLCGEVDVFVLRPRAETILTLMLKLSFAGP